MFQLFAVWLDFGVSQELCGCLNRSRINSSVSFLGFSFITDCICNRLKRQPQENREAVKELPRDAITASDREYAFLPLINLLEKCFYKLIALAYKDLPIKCA